MKLKRLAILTLPGIEQGFELNNFDGGVNVITGPNAVGKSSLVRAMRYLVVAPQSSDPRALALTAEFDNGGRWMVQRTGSAQVWECDGQPAEPPALPDGDALQSYWLSMENLLEAGSGEEQLVAMLRRELTGGFDLRTLRSREFEPRPRVGQTEETRLREAERALREAETHYRQLAKEESELRDLTHDIEAAREAAACRGKLAAALRLVEICNERERIAVGLEEFPEKMENLRGDELNSLARLDQRGGRCREELEVARRAREEAQAKLETTGLKKVRPHPGELEAQRISLGEIRSRRDRIEDRRARLDEAYAAETGARIDLGGGEDLPELAPATISSAEKLANELQDRQTRRKELTRRIEDSGGKPSDEEITRHMNAAEALRNWQAAGGNGGVSWPAVALIGAGALAAIVVGTGAWVSVGRGAWMGWVAIAGGVAVLAGSAWAMFVKGDEGVTRAQQRFAETGLAEPPDWSRDGVASRLNEIDQNLTKLRQQRDRAAAAEADRNRLTGLERELTKLEDERGTLAGELGFDPALTAIGIDHFVRVSQSWREARDRVESLNREIQRLEGESESDMDAVRTFLAEWGVESETDPAHLQAALDQLAIRCQQAIEAERDITERCRDIQQAKGRLEEVESELAELFERVGVRAGALDALRKRLDQLEEWKAQQERLRDNQRREAEVRQELHGEDALLQRAEADEGKALMSEQDELDHRAERLEALQKRRTEIQTRLAEAGADRRLEKSLAIRDAAWERLAERRDEVLLAEAGQALLDGIESEFRSEHEPKVLQDARERFQRFTHNTWDVELDDAGDLMARDLTQDVRRKLNALSSATRMQLLLAVRLAWIDHLERHIEPLPLFLDEALTTSDEKRFARIVENLEQLATKEDRQIFYLSARRHDLGLWAQFRGNEPHHVDLSRERFGKVSTVAEDFVLPEGAPKPVPAPDGFSPESYAELLGIPQVDPRQPAGDLHLFHLLRDDLALLHELLQEWGIDRLGPLENLLASNAATAAINDAGRRETLRTRCHASRAWVAAWREGRGKPVDRIALEASGTVSDKYLESVSEYAGEVGGDSEKLLQALREKNDERLKGFLNRKVNELESWLIENDYLGDVEPLEREDREHRTLFTVGQHAAPEEIRPMVAWLEAGYQDLDAKGE